MFLSLPELRDTFANPAVLTRTQVIAAVGPSGMRRAVDHDILQRISQGIYAPREHAQAWWTGCAAAVLALSPRAAVTGRAALFLWRLEDRIPTTRDVVVPASASTSRRITGVNIVRTSVDFQVYRVAGLSVVEPELAVFQAMRGLSDEQARALAISVLASRIIRLDRVRQLLADHTRLPGHPHVARALALVNDGIHSPLEFDASRTVLRGPLAKCFVRQYDVIAGPHRYRVDAFDRAAMLAVEFDGMKYHSRPEQIHGDRERDVWLATVGIQVMRFMTSDVRNRPQHCRERIEEVRRLRLARVRSAA